MRPVPVLSDYLVKLVIPASRAILKPAVIYRFVSLIFTLQASSATARLLQSWAVIFWSISGLEKTLLPRRNL